MTRVHDSPQFSFANEHDHHSLQSPGLDPEKMKNSTYNTQSIASSALSLLSQGLYKITQFSLFRILSITTLTWCISSLSLKFFQDYTCIKETERLCISIITQYPLLPVVLLIVATITLKALPLLAISISVASGVLTGFSLRTKWNIAIMHARQTENPV